MSLLERLAQLVGFHTSYVDAFGNEVYANDEARRALLSAMGYDLSSDHAIESSNPSTKRSIMEKNAAAVAYCEK